MFPIDRHAHVVLTVRADRVRHGGQVSLPGGVVEPGETFEQAALREAHEEVALAAEGVEFVGPLTPLDIPVSGFRLHPIVAAAAERPALDPADGEVARILEVDVDALFDRERDRVAGDDPRRRDAAGPGLAVARRRNLGRHGDGAGRVPDAAGLAGTLGEVHLSFVHDSHESDRHAA